MEAPEFKITLVVDASAVDYLEGTRALLRRIVEADQADREADGGDGRAWITRAYAAEARRLLDVLHAAPADAFYGPPADDEAARTWFDDQGNPILLDSAGEVLARRKAAALELAALWAHMAAHDARGAAPGDGTPDRPAAAPAAPTRDPGVPDNAPPPGATGPGIDRLVSGAARQADRLARPTAMPSSDALARAHGGGLAPGATVETPGGPAPAAVGSAPWCARCDGYHVPGCRC